ncbi:MAG: cardiolipin synthase [Synergistaceae bacterium]
MWSKTKIIILAIIVAFIAGNIPTLLDFFSQNTNVTHAISNIYSTLNKYLYHLIIIYSLIVAYIIFLEGQNPDRTLLWLVALIFIPVIGVLIYIIIGPDPSAYKRKREYMKPEIPENTECPEPSDCKSVSFLAKLLYSVSSAKLLKNNKVDILIDGVETFTPLKKALREATKYIHFQYFIINNDSLGQEIRDILIEAANRGVTVRVLYDAIGSWSLNKEYTQMLENAGIECNSFYPVSFARFRRKMNYRNHRKIVVVDGEIAFTGGLNIGDEYLGKGALGYWRDTHIRIVGEAVEELNKIFIHDWCTRTEEKQKDIYDEIKTLEKENNKDYTSLPETPLQVVPSGIFTPWHSIAKGYFSMISRATERVWIATPYFVPGNSLVDTIVNTSLSGVDVRLMMPRSKDHFLVHWASKSNFEKLLIAGVRIFLYEKGFLHSKTMLSDKNVSSVGTCNMDVRSLEINFENQLFIYDREINNSFATQFEKDIKDCTEITLEEWLKRPLWQKILESFGKLYSAQI